MLVSARPNNTSNKQVSKSSEDNESDPDLKRAKDLLELHSTVKVAHQDGSDEELNNARDAVRRVLRQL